MILCFKTNSHIWTDKQHFDIKQASMIVQERETRPPQSLRRNAEGDPRGDEAD